MTYLKVLSMKHGPSGRDLRSRIFALLNHHPDSVGTWLDLTAEQRLTLRTSPYFSVMSREQGEADLRELSHDGAVPGLFIYLPRTSIWASLTTLVSRSDSENALKELFYVIPNLDLFSDDPLVHLYYCESREHIRMYRPVVSMEQLVQREGMTPLNAAKVEQLAISLAQLIPKHYTVATYLKMVDHFERKNIVFNTINHESKLSMELTPKESSMVYDDMFLFLSEMQDTLLRNERQAHPAEMLSTLIRRNVDVFRGRFPAFTMEYESIEEDRAHARMLN